MIIRSCTLQNIRSYKDAHIEFPEGSVLLHGDIGSGKSTILLAIEFALFGIRRGFFSGTALLRKGEKIGSVTLVCDIDGQKVKIERTLKKTAQGVQAGSGSLSIEGVESEATASELTAKMTELLHYPLDSATKKNWIYRYTVYTPQAEMQRILHVSPEERLGTIRRVFGIDKYHRIAQNATLVVKQLKEDIKELGIRSEQRDALLSQKERVELDLANLVKGDRALFEQAEGERKREEEVLQGMKEEIQKIVGMKKQVEAHRAQREEILRRERMLQKDLEDLDKKIDLVEIKREELDIIDTEPALALQKKVKDLRVRFQQKKEEKYRLDKNYGQLLRDETHHRELLERVQKLIEQYNKNISQERELKTQLGEKEIIEKKIAAAKTIVEDKQNKLELLRERLDQDAESYNAFASLTTCPTCFQAVGNEHKERVRTARQEHNKQLEDQRRQLAKEVETAKAAVREYTMGRERFTEIEQELVVLQETKKRRDEKLEEERELKEKISAASRQKQDVEHLLEKLEGLDEISALIEKTEEKLEMSREMEKKKGELKHLREREEEYKDRRKKVERELTQLQHDKRKYEENVGDYQEKIGKLTDISLKEKEQQEKVERLQIIERELLEKVVKGEKEEEMLKKELGQIVAKVAQMDELVEEAKRLEEKQKWIQNDFIPLQSLLEKSTLQTVFHQCNDAYKGWFASLLEDEGMQTRLDESFAPLVMQNGHDVELEHLSGGEKTATSLAYRLALNKVITTQMGDIKTKDLLILDEPTEGFSAEQLDKVRDVLDEIPSSQVIIVSHESKIESFVDHVIRVEKEMQVSRVL